MHDPKATGLAAWHLLAANRHVRALLDVLLQHELIIHLVDVISGEQYDKFGVVGLDDVDVLVNCVGCPEIPVLLGNALTGRQNIEAFVSFGTKKIPTHLQVSNEAMCLVLGGNRDAADARIHSVGEGKIDNARLATKIDGRLGASISQFQKP